MLLGSLQTGPSSPSPALLIPLLPDRGPASALELFILEKGRGDTQSLPEPGPQGSGEQNWGSVYIMIALVDLESDRLVLNVWVCQ